jgi:hypothetical protein
MFVLCALCKLCRNRNGKEMRQISCKKKDDISIVEVDKKSPPAKHLRVMAALIEAGISSPNFVSSL